MLSVLIREVGFLCRDSPINAKAVIKDTDASICLWMIELIAFILEHGGLAQYGKAMSETFGNEELAMNSLIPSFSKRRRSTKHIFTR